MKGWFSSDIPLCSIFCKKKAENFRVSQAIPTQFTKFYHLVLPLSVSYLPNVLKFMTQNLKAFPWNNKVAKKYQKICSWKIYYHERKCVNFLLENLDFAGNFLNFLCSWKSCLAAMKDRQNIILTKTPPGRVNKSLKLLFIEFGS